MKTRVCLIALFCLIGLAGCVNKKSTPEYSPRDSTPTQPTTLPIGKINGSGQLPVPLNTTFFYNPNATGGKGDPSLTTTDQYQVQSKGAVAVQNFSCSVDSVLPGDSYTFSVNDVTQPNSPAIVSVVFPNPNGGQNPGNLSPYSIQPQDNITVTVIQTAGASHTPNASWTCDLVVPAN